MRLIGQWWRASGTGRRDNVKQIIKRERNGGNDGVSGLHSRRTLSLVSYWLLSTREGYGVPLSAASVVPVCNNYTGRPHWKRLSTNCHPLCRARSSRGSSPTNSMQQFSGLFQTFFFFFNKIKIVRLGSGKTPPTYGHQELSLSSYQPRAARTHGWINTNHHQGPAVRESCYGNRAVLFPPTFPLPLFLSLSYSTIYLFRYLLVLSFCFADRHSTWVNWHANTQYGARPATDESTFFVLFFKFSRFFMIFFSCSLTGINETFFERFLISFFFFYASQVLFWARTKGTWLFFRWRMLLDHPSNSKWRHVIEKPNKRESHDDDEDDEIIIFSSREYNNKRLGVDKKNEEGNLYGSMRRGNKTAAAKDLFW